ncbi:hypothetical protein BSLG_000097 [Batrachochytrium salamandrivorans]|nr:hypothetical protein BSLG_000097 [Batrachochytrium salamandrivorans]
MEHPAVVTTTGSGVDTASISTVEGEHYLPLATVVSATIPASLSVTTSLTPNPQRQSDITAASTTSAKSSSLPSSADTANSLPLIHLSKVVDPGVPEYREIQTNREKILKMLDSGMANSFSYGSRSEVATSTISTPAASASSYSSPVVAAQVYPKDSLAASPKHSDASVSVLHTFAIDSQSLLSNNAHGSIESDTTYLYGNDPGAFNGPLHQSHGKNIYYANGNIIQKTASLPAQIDNSAACPNAHQCIAHQRLVRDLKTARSIRLRHRDDQETKTLHEDEFAQLRDQYTNLHTSLEAVQVDFDELQVASDSLRDERDGFEIAIRQTAADLARAKTDHIQYKNELAMANTLLSDRQVYIQSLERQLLLSNTVPSSLYSLSGDSGIPVDTVSDDSVTLKNAHSHVVPHSSLEDISAYPVSDLTATHNAIEALQLEARSLANKLEAAETQSNEMSARLTAKISECDQLNFLVATHDEECHSYNSKITELSDQIETLRLAQTQHDDSTSTVGTMLCGHSALEMELSNARIELTDLRLQLDKCIEDNEKLKRLDAEIRATDRTRLSVENDILRRENKGLYVTMEQVKAFEDRLLHDYRELGRTEVILRDDIKALLAKSECSLKKDIEYAELTRQLKAREQEIVSLNEELSSYHDDSKKRLDKEKETLMDQHNELKSQYLGILANASDALLTLSEAELAVQQYPILERVLNRLRDIDQDRKGLVWL